MGPEEGLLYADCNLELGVLMKLPPRFRRPLQFRPDSFQLKGIISNQATAYICGLTGRRAPVNAGQKEQPRCRRRGSRGWLEKPDETVGWAK